MSTKKCTAKRLCAGLLSALIISSGYVALPTEADAAAAEDKNVTDYTYTVTPILAPFNEYFFVKTDNPDPTSFRFADKSSVYDEDSSISFDWDNWDNEANLYMDIKYDNKETGRVNGGYIFKSFDTDGGEIVLQSKNYSSWDDTKVKLKLPALKDDVDYLIDTYAKKSNFFDNMDAVQSGFSSICLYSGSYIRGELYKAGSFWSLSTSPHIDQTFYIQSPYTRKDSKSLFASAIYPFRYDSLGFPSMMGAVSKRLSSSSSYKWSSASHAYIDVTYNGETRTYGGQGSGKGQGISEDKIKQNFTFGANGTKITLDGVRQLLNDYAAVEMADDVPRKEALTWGQVCDKVGNGAWVRLTGLNSIFGGTSTAYTYLYKTGDGKNFWTDDAGNNGSQIYWGGDLGYACDAWVDGRYINSWESFVPGEKFEDHSTSSIILNQVKIPQITYDVKNEYNYTTGEYELKYSNVQITEKEKTVLFYYNEDKKIWIAESDAFDDGCASYYNIVTLTEKGVIDKKYLDMVTLTLDEVKALKVDKNTNTVPAKGFIYDGTAKPGTPYAIVALTDKNITVSLSSSSSTYTGKAITPAVTVKYGSTTLKNGTDYTVSYKSNTNVGTATVTITGKGNYTGTKTATFKIVAPTVAKPTNLKSTQSASAVKLTWNKASGVDSYGVYVYDAKAGKYKGLATVTGTSYTVKNLKAGTTYKFAVRSNKKVGGTTFHSSNAVGTVNTKFAKVKSLKATQSTSAVKLSWSKVSGATSYDVYQKIGGKWKKIAATKSTSYTVKKLKAGTVYNFAVRANKVVGKTTYYGEFAFITTATKIATPTMSVKAAGSRRATVTWKKVSGATGYQIYMSTKKTSGYKKVATVSPSKKASYTKTGLTKGKTYYVRVRTYKTVNGTNIYSGYQTKTVKIK